MCVRIWLEVGHACEPRNSGASHEFSLDWRLWVRGARGDISAFVHKVVFKLRPTSEFMYPKLVRQEPPYEIQESSSKSIDIPIEVYLKFHKRPKKICLKYSLYIESIKKVTSESTCVYYDFENPSEALCRALMQGGGEVIARTGKSDKSGRMCVRIWLEVGHACEPRNSGASHEFSLDWRLWVRGARGDISAFVHKVVFKLRPTSEFMYPKLVRQEPPYEIQESSSKSIDIPIEVYLKFHKRPKKICLKYSLYIESIKKVTSESTCVYYDFENPSEALCRALMQGGGEVIARTGKSDKSGKLVVLNSEGQSEDNTSNKKMYKYIKPVHCEHRLKTSSKSGILDETSEESKRDEMINSDLKEQLRIVKMREDEINQVTQLYKAYTEYEKSENALELPPLSNPIYQIPELPASLRGALASVEADYAMQ